MKRTLALVLLLAACAGQSTVPVWLNPGTPALRAEQDFLSCASNAERSFPERRGLGTIGVSVGTGFCRGSFCLGGTRGIANTGSRRDARNEALRDRALDACLQARGYTQTTLPACPPGPVTVLQSQPFDTRGLCVTDGRIATR